MDIKKHLKSYKHTERERDVRKNTETTVLKVISKKASNSVHLQKAGERNIHTLS